MAESGVFLLEIAGSGVESGVPGLGIWFPSRDWELPSREMGLLRTGILNFESFAGCRRPGASSLSDLTN